MESEAWKLFRVFPDRVSAELLARLLESEGVPTLVQSYRLEQALRTEWQVCVSAELAHRARWILLNHDFSEAELEYLATGKLPKFED